LINPLSLSSKNQKARRRTNSAGFFLLRSNPFWRITLGGDQCSPINQASLIVQLQ
jgi:hypothetical protein